MVSTGTGINLFQLLDDWFKTAPYISAFCVTAFKATLSDLIAQRRERAAASRLVPRDDFQDILLETALTEGERLNQTKRTILETTVDVVTCDSSSSCDIVPMQAVATCDDEFCEVEPKPGIVWRRTLAFLLYGGLYQGCVQYFIFNECFPRWFGSGEDVWTVATKVLFDLFALTPFLCLPFAYLFKAFAFRYSPAEGISRYLEDAKRDLLVKYWIFWGPTQCITFGVMPAQWRIPFIAAMSFFWLITLSTISSRGDAAMAKQ
jgi:protein Mpv17